MNSRFQHPRISAFFQFAVVAACLLLVSCGGGGGGGGGGSATAPNPVIVSIGANPTALTAGQSTTLTWSSSNATGCQASSTPAGSEWSGTVALSGSKLVTPPATGTFTYTLTCDGVAKSVAIVVANPATPPTVSLSLAPASVPAGQSSKLTWSTTNAISCDASSNPPGTWTGSQAVSGSITVTQAVAGTYTYSLTCSGNGGSASGSVTLGVTGLASNAALVFIDSGPAGAGNVINVPFVNVTLCRPGTSICQTIDHVLVDTASFGLRIIAGVLDPSLALPAVTTGANSNSVGECAQFVSGFMWGSVHRADVKIADEIAPSLPVQQVDAAFGSIPSACSSSGGNFGMVAALGANGILGVGLFNQDCGSTCAAQVIPGTYYECTASTCASIKMPLANQVANPVAAFATDNNGVTLTMPAVAAGGATTLTGTLIFGIDTQSNNNVGSATVYAADPRTGNFTTTYKGVALTSSFLDSGSNGFFFDDVAIPVCSVQSGFYCPTNPLRLSAVNTSANGASGPVDFTIVNLQALDASIRAASVGGSSGQSGSFNWGMPFFFGRTVFVAIAGANTQHGKGPYWAY